MADVKISGLPASTVPLAGTEVLPIVQSGTTKQVSIANVTAGRAIAATSITTDTYKAASSSGGALQNLGGTPQLQWGAGGGNNLSVDVAININPANAAVAISPTGTGTVAISPAGALTINPTAASTINNTSIGATTASTGRFTSVTATTGNVVIGTSGQGIDFSATPGTGTSELLADYEEGTWTPLVSDGVNNATMNSSNGGYYTKIGRCVTFTAHVGVQTIGSVGADAIIKDLPFTNGSATSAFRAGVSFGFGSSLAITQGRVVTGYVEINQSYIPIMYWDATTGTTGLDGSEITDGGTFFISGVYFIS
jgi:hypothetical protein